VGVRNIVDLPGVGTNYQDHNRGVAGVYRIDGVPDDTADAFIRQDPDTLARWNSEYTTGQGPMAWNFVDAGSKLRPTMKELSKMGPDFKEVWDEIYEPNPDKATISTAIAAM
jgi:alcohol oxidase